MTSLEEYEEAKKNAPQTRLIIDKLYELTCSGTVKWYKSGHSGKYIFWCRHGSVKFCYWPHRFSISLGQGWLLGFEITYSCGRVHHFGGLGYENGDLSKLTLEIEKGNPSFFNDEKNKNNKDVDTSKTVMEIMELLSKAQ